MGDPTPLARPKALLGGGNYLASSGPVSSVRCLPRYERPFPKDDPSPGGVEPARQRAHCQVVGSERGTFSHAPRLVAPLPRSTTARSAARSFAAAVIATRP